MSQRDLGKALQRKKPADLAWQEWDFSKVPLDQVSLCYEYELSRDTHSKLEKIKGLRATLGNPSFDQCMKWWTHPETMPADDTEAEQLAQTEFIYGSQIWWFDEFPDQPFQSISKHDRKRLAEPEGNWGAITMNFRRLIREFPQVAEEHGKWEVPIDERSTAVALLIDWTRNNDELIRNFKDWLTAFRPKGIAIVDRKNGAGAPVRQLRARLKALGAWRLLRRMDWADAYALTEGRLFGNNQSTWKAAKDATDQLLKGNG